MDFYERDAFKLGNTVIDRMFQQGAEASWYGTGIYTSTFDGGKPFGVQILVGPPLAYSSDSPCSS